VLQWPAGPQADKHTTDHADKLNMTIETISTKHLPEEELTALLKRDSEAPTITLILPMKRLGAETRENPLIFKNALSEAKERLSSDLPETGDELNATLAELGELEQPTDDFWQHQEEGLVLTTDPYRVRAYQLPYPVEPFVHLGSRPYLIPLMRLTGGSRFHVLILDLNEVRLIRSDRWTSEPVSLKDIPTSLEEAMRFDDPEKSLQQRSVTSSNLPGSGGGDVAFHGHGVTGDETRQKKIRRFFEQIDKGLPASFEDREMPLVLCGSEAEVGLFHEVNHFPHLVETPLDFNPSNLSHEAIGEKIREWIAERDVESRRTLLDDLQAGLGRDLATTDFEKVAEAAVEGRIARFYFQEGTHRFGSRNADTGTITVHPERKPGDAELVAEVAAAAVGTGSEIACFPADEPLPDNAPVAALFRY